MCPLFVFLLDKGKCPLVTKTFGLISLKKIKNKAYLRPLRFSLSFLFKIAVELFPHFDLTLLVRIAVPELSVLEIGGIFNLHFVQDILTSSRYLTDIGLGIVFNPQFVQDILTLKID